MNRLAQFHADGNRLSDVDGARMLVALETISTRDALWGDMSGQNTASHTELWTDLTRRAPDEVRAAPAAMLGFASWLRGDGAKAWCALDQVPADQPYSMAALVASALQNALHPREWQRHQTKMRKLGDDLDEARRREHPATQRHRTSAHALGRTHTHHARPRPAHRPHWGTRSRPALGRPRVNATRDGVDEADRLADIQLGCTRESGDPRVTRLVHQTGAGDVLGFEGWLPPMLRTTGSPSSICSCRSRGGVLQQAVWPMPLRKYESTPLACRR